MTIHNKARFTQSAVPEFTHMVGKTRPTGPCTQVRDWKHLKNRRVMYIYRNSEARSRIIVAVEKQ